MILFGVRVAHLGGDEMGFIPMCANVRNTNIGCVVFSRDEGAFVAIYGGRSGVSLRVPDAVSFSRWVRQLYGVSPRDFRSREWGRE